LYEHEARKKVLSAFYVARAILVVYDIEGTSKLATPSLLAEALSGRASIFALFGGQGINEIYFDDLQTLFNAYRPLIEPFLVSIIDEDLRPLASFQGTSFYKHSLSDISWLTGAVPLDYFAFVPVSFPLIGLTQFTQYLVAARVSGPSPAELSAHFSGTSGRSQGLVTAMVMYPSSIYIQV
jgi:fatty acid synthase subunit alpha